MPAPLRHTKFRLLFAARFVSTLGNSVAPVALAFAVLELTGSVTDLGLVVGARSVANVVFLLFGGVLADRLPRSVILVGSSTLSAISQGVIAVMFLSGDATIPVLMALGAFNGIVSAFAYPAAAALTPQTVPAELRQSANALLRLASHGAMVLGAPLGAMVIAATSPGWGLVIDACSFLVAGMLFGVLRVPAVARPEAREGTFHQLRMGWREFVSRDWLWSVVVGFMFLNGAIVAAENVLGPAIAKDTIGIGSWGVVLGVQTLGMVLGAVFAMRVKVRKLLLFGVASIGALVLLPLALAFVPTLPALATAGFIAGFCTEQFGVAWETTMQKEIPADMLARVYSYDMLGSFIAIPLGQMAVGPISETAGVLPTLVGAAAVVLLCTLGMLAVRGVRTVEHVVLASPQPVSSV